jgi:reverse gyrase
MTREEAVKEIEKAFEPAFANYIIIALTEGATVSDKVLEQEARKGHWIKYDKNYFIAEKLTPVIHSIRECSECYTRIADFCGEMKYCPNCGAKMESGGNK